MGKRFYARTAFTAYNFEVVKLYCLYDIRVKIGDLIDVGNLDSIWGSAFAFIEGGSSEFAYSRVAEKDHWLVDLQFERNPGQFGGIIAPVKNVLDREGFDLSIVLEETH